MKRSHLSSRTRWTYANKLSKLDPNLHTSFFKMCCRSRPEETIIVNDLQEPPVPDTFEDLLDNIGGEVISGAEFSAMRDALLSRPEWRNPTSRNMAKLREDLAILSGKMIQQTKKMGQSFWAVCMINEKLSGSFDSIKLE